MENLEKIELRKTEKNTRFSYNKKRIKRRIRVQENLVG